MISDRVAKSEDKANTRWVVVCLVTPISAYLLMIYKKCVLALTRHFAKLSISPESSDGFASVGTILPKEEATLLPGGLFAFPEVVWRSFLRRRMVTKVG